MTRIITILACFGLFGSSRAHGLDLGKSIYQYNLETFREREGLPSSGVSAIAQSRDGYLWIGTRAGIARFTGIDFQPITAPNNPEWRGELGVVTSICPTRAGGIWFGTDDKGMGYY